jgi:TRAP-type transport system periplasmic protein
MLRRFMAVAAAATLLTPLATEAQQTLIFATASPPEGAISRVFFEDWVERVNADGQGVVRIDLRHGFQMANPANFYDRVTGGVVPISWGILTTVGGQFPLTGMLELPFLADDVERASIAFWRLIQSGLLDEEFRDIVPLYVTAFPQAGIHLSAPIANLDTLNGASVIAGSRTNGAVIQALGGTPLSINAADAYEAIRRGTADGRFISWTAFQPFRMDEITFHHIEAPIGTAIGAVFINRDVWRRLSEEARAIVMRHSGEEQTRRLARFFHEENESMRSRIDASDNHRIVAPSEAQLAAWERMLEPVRAGWLERTPRGAEVLARFEELLEEAGR